MTWEYGAVDIETVGRNPLDSGHSCIVAIGARKITEEGDVEHGEWVARGTVKNPETGEEQPGWKDQVEAVEKMIEFFEQPADDALLYTFNGTSFDFTYLRHHFRNEDYGDLTRRVANLENHHVDLRSKALENDFYKGLEDLCEKLGIEHEVDCSGSQVQNVWEDEDWGLLRMYVREDVRVTLEVARRFKEAFN